MPVFSFKNIRILILLIILATVLIHTQQQRISTQFWYNPLQVTIFPINGDGSVATEQYISQLSDSDFKDIDHFFAQSGQQYQLVTATPIVTELGKQISRPPPSPPVHDHALFKIMWWSLKLRYWAYRNTPDDRSNSDRVRLYVIYHQGQKDQALNHSLGLQKGLIGIINAFALTKQNAQNALVMAHEILHTLGATDKYNMHNLQPLYPEGYAHPLAQPRYPQHHCEIMAGRIPQSVSQATMPKSLKQCTIGDITAKEINWID